MFDESFDHIPSITLEIGRGKATRTTVHYYYREWKNGVTGEGDAPSQLAHLRKHISQWQEIANTGRNFVTLGDANLCALTWNETDYKLKDLSNEVQCSIFVNHAFNLSTNTLESRRLVTLYKDPVWTMSQQTPQINAISLKSSLMDPVIIFL